MRFDAVESGEWVYGLPERPGARELLRDGLLVKKDRKSGEITTLSCADWQEVIDVNLTGATWIVRDAVAQMARDEIAAGIVVNMSSLSRHGNRGQSTYVAAKAALAANTATWAREFAPFRIRVGALARAAFRR